MNWTIRIALALTLAASFGSSDAYAHPGHDHTGNAHPGHDLTDNDGLAHCGDCAGDKDDHAKKADECEDKAGKDAECKDSAAKDAKDKAGTVSYTHLTLPTTPYV